MDNYYDSSLLTIAYSYLIKKHHREIYIWELLDACEMILKKIEHKRRNKLSQRIVFKDNGAVVKNVFV